MVGSSSAALTLAAVAPLVAPQVSEVESSTLPSVMPVILSLSLVTSPFPQELMDRAQLGKFVDLRILLTDNVSLLQQLDIFSGHHTFPLLPGRLSLVTRARKHTG